MAGALTISTLKDSSGVLATQNGMTGIAKAWAQWNSSGTIAGAFNVSSVTLQSTGVWLVNFTTAMANTNYSIVYTAQSISSNQANTNYATISSASQAAVYHFETTSGTAITSNFNCVVVHGN